VLFHANGTIPLCNGLVVRMHLKSSFSKMKSSSLRKRIRNGSVLMLLIVVGIGAVALPTIYRLGGAIRVTVYGNYISIEAAQHMHRALDALQFAQQQGTLKQVLPVQRNIFRHWIAEEFKHTVEAGEPELAAEIERRGNRLFTELSATSFSSTIGLQFSELHGHLDELIRMNRAGMFRADSGASRLSNRLTVEFAAGLIILLIVGIAVSGTLAWKISEPLTELAGRLRSFSLQAPPVRLGEQPLAELQTVAAEFNKMAERLVDEKNKTEAIIASLEDGVVVVDPNGVVTHINEVAAIILGTEDSSPLGRPFNDLGSRHPHYLRVRDAVQTLSENPTGSPRIELDLHMRGRDHAYVVKLIPMQPDEERTLGNILILQDVTYVRDQDRARVNLVATLSHELKTPVTSLALSAGLLDREKTRLEPKQQEFLAAISEDVVRMRRLVNDLLDVARGSTRMIAVRNVEIDVCHLVQSVTKTFRLRARERNISLSTVVGADVARIHGDPVKISWAISNLISNALRYTPEGGSVAISSEDDNDVVRLKVSDTGPGIPAEFRNHLFERFTQWDVDGSEPGSAGLGLAIVKDIVEGHGGRIFVDSTMGMGTTFTIELPIRQAKTWQSF
jgi:NtrC-family two-component system sensor histidine kinase KinB